MKIARVSISNILGIEQLQFEAGKFNEISGPNGKGKTSVLEAIKSAVKGGEDATLIRNGSEKGEVVLVLDDETTIRRRLTAKTSTTAVIRGGKQVARPAEVIKSITDMLSMNPVDFLRAPAKKRVDVLLESLPMTADPEKIAAITGQRAADVPRGHALVVIELARQSVYDQRTGANRAAKEKEATINQLAATLPDNEIDVPEGAGALVKQLQDIDAAKEAELKRITDKLAGLRKDHEAHVDGLREEKASRLQALQDQIDSVRAEFDADIAEAKESFTETERRAGEAREEASNDFAEQRQGVATQLSTIEAAQSQRAKHQQTRETIRTMRAEADALFAEADTHSNGIAALDAYKAELLSSLPVDGLEVKDGELYRHEVPFDRLNTAQQVEIAVEIAKLRHGELGVICVDGLELLDHKHFEAFKEQALASGLQLFVTRVSDDEFGISTEE